MATNESHTPAALGTECRHRVRFSGRTGVVACAACGLLEFFGAAGPLDPAEGVAALFGNYDLIGKVPAVGAPAAQVLAYRPARGRKATLSLLPVGCWMRVSDELWLASDGSVLLLATPNRLMVDNLTRGA